MKICIHKLIKLIQTFKPFIFYLSFFYNCYYNFENIFRMLVITLLRSCVI